MTGADPPPIRRVGAAARWGSAPLGVLLPVVVWYLWISVDRNAGWPVIPGVTPGWRTLLTTVPWPTALSVAILAAWFAWHALLDVLLPGPVVEGRPLRSGRRLRYRLNGLLALVITLGALASGVALGWLRPSVLHAELGPLLATATVFSAAFGLYLYAHGKRWPDDGATVQGNLASELFLGTARNPRWGGCDLKLFFEARPGLIGWIVLDLALAHAQYERTGTVSPAMVVVVACQVLYVVDYFVHEEAILSTWDIRHENLGFMLLFGDVVWVPFTYSLQALWLLQAGPGLPGWALAGVVALNLAGYAIFRTANLQKHRFRKDPERPVWGRRPEALRTAEGSLLLVSGWWGLSRHANYLGDLIMGLAWCLACGLTAPLPYFYIVFFTILLLHRERRDHRACAAKYGADWEAYTRRVRWRIVPWVY
jgi:protein-S-isoprenylcysteine O-methyltransferase Ste14